MKSNTKLFGISAEEDALVQKLLREYRDDSRELDSFDEYLERCGNENVQRCFRTITAAFALSSFLTQDEGVTVEELEEEFQRLGFYAETLGTADCQEITKELVGISGLIDLTFRHREEAALIDESFATARFAKILQEGGLLDGSLSPAVLEFLKSKDYEW